MNAKELFEVNLGVIDRAIAIVCRRAHLFGPDAEDFASEAKLALIEDDYAILRKWEGRSSLDTFLTVVVQRLLFDARMRAKGRWHASAEAQRLGPTAVLLETLVRRDGRTLDEAMPHVRSADPNITREALEDMLQRLPERVGRPRAVDLDAASDTLAGGEPADARAIERDTHRIASIAGGAVRDVLGTLPVEDRLLIRMRFGSEMSIADISRMTRLPQRPLYRRLESLLGRLRSALAEAGIDQATAADLIGRPMDFGLLNEKSNGKSELPGQSMQTVAENAREET